MAEITIPEGAVEWKGFWAFPWNLPEKRPGAYRFTNLINGKPYIGIGEILHKRCRAHAVGHSPRKFKNAVNKYGKGAFLVEPIFYSISGVNCLHEAEAALIIDHDAIRNGYNIIEAGGRIGPYGEAFSEALRAAKGTPEARARQQRASKATWDSWSEEERARLYEGRDAYLARPEVSAAQSEKMKAIWADPEQRASRIANSKAAKAALPEEARQEAAAKISASYTEERRAKAAIAIEDKILRNPEAVALGIAKSIATRQTPESLARQRVAQNDPTLTASRRALALERWKDPEFRENTIAAIRMAKALEKAQKQDPQFDLPFYPAADSES